MNKLNPRLARCVSPIRQRGLTLGVCFNTLLYNRSAHTCSSLRLCVDSTRGNRNVYETASQASNGCSTNRSDGLCLQEYKAQVFVLVNQLYVSQHFTKGGTWTWNVYILPCSYASDSTNPGRTRNANAQHPLHTLKR